VSKDIYNVAAYEKFARELIRALEGPNIKRVNMRTLRGKARKTGMKTVFGSFGWRSAQSSRIGPRTVYLGGEPVRLTRPSDLHKELIEKSPDELERVLHVIRTFPFLHLERQMGDNDRFNPRCNLYMSAADLKNYRQPFMWGNTMGDPQSLKKRPGPKFIMIHIPEEHRIRQQVLALPELNINIALGTDYMGEDKKGFLRQAMYSADKEDMLGLHAGTKIVHAVDAASGKLKKYVVFLFGLSATGKSTWSCHQLGLDYGKGEKTEVAQDDIVFLCRDGSSLGSESGFFVKTDVDETLQESMYNALIDKSALMENVMIDSAGRPDFLDETLCANGRAVIQKSKLMVERRGRLRPIAAKGLNTPPLDEVDGIMFAFITRRNTMMSFAQRLNPEQAVLAYLWGESSHSYATQPSKAGESVRTVGTDPFIVGSRGHKVNLFRDIIMELTEKYPGKVSFYQYNTGGMGEIVETINEGGVKKKNMIRKVERVPINLMAAIQRGDVRGTNSYEMGPLGVERVVKCVDSDLGPFNPDKFYSPEQIDSYIRDLVNGRRKFTEEVAEEGLASEILRVAEESYRISPDDHSRVFVRRVEPQAEKTGEDTSSGNVFKPWRPRDRQGSSRTGWRYG
jgi:phosphoenolpyruvate carboxykinase (ATP)